MRQKHGAPVVIDHADSTIAMMVQKADKLSPSGGGG